MVGDPHRLYLVARRADLLDRDHGEKAFCVSGARRFGRLLKTNYSLLIYRYYLN